MSEKKQFDQFLGGSIELPREVNILKLASARASEIAAMTYSIENPHQTKLIFQKLPVHMRRRIMSHNVKRLPQRLRSGHSSQMKKSGLPPKGKRPPRKYRRRPQNLLLEYNRRQRNKIWLETHIWHAKRFKMIERWGFRLANRSNDKCFRANYRAVAKHCLIQDISYYSCIEIEGHIELLKQILKRHCGPNNLTFFAKFYVNGEREGTLMFYRKDGYPKFPLGHVHFLWKMNNIDLKTIWIWVPPAIYNDVFYEIVDSFKFQLSNQIDKNEDALTISQNEKTPSYTNEDGCRMVLLRNSLNRFRLRGPLSLSILADVLNLPKAPSELKKQTIKIETNLSLNGDNESTEVSDSWKKESSGKPWYQNYYEIKENVEVFNIQCDAFNTLKNLHSPDQLPSDMILGLTVLDPRFYFPSKRTKTCINSPTVARFPKPLSSTNQSPIWDSSVRCNVFENVMTTSELNNLRSKHLVPGVSNDQYVNEDIVRKIPILLIQKNGNLAKNYIGFASGIDVVLPAGWAMPFWLSFILRCARPGALRESKSIAFESFQMNSPDINNPDTPAYKNEAELIKTQLMEAYFRKPPNRRVNFVKFAISSPFFCEWNILVKEWSDSDEFYVLRNRHALANLSDEISFKSKKNKSTESTLDTSEKNCLVPVKISMERKGCCRDFSIICLPTKEDIKKLRNNKNWQGPVQSFVEDHNEEKRHTLRRGHLALLKRLRRKRIRVKKNMEKINSDNPIESMAESNHFRKLEKLIKTKLVNCNSTLIDKQAQTMANLYLPKCTVVRHSCDREVIGYVIHGDFCYSEAKGIGLGYVVLPSLSEMIKNGSNIVLVRNTQTRQFRIAKLEILHM